jgi:ectoine hydroxylase-related dioxygenase (phytanoyl-CoA dioxygenase family)
MLKIMLTKTQIEKYREVGAIVVEGVLDDVTRRHMNQVLADLVERSRVIKTHDKVYDLEPGHSSEDPRVRRIKTPHLVHPIFAEFMRSSGLIGILRDLLGNSVRLHGAKLNLKSPRFGSPVEWHQDWAFYPHTNDDLLAVGVMLDDTTVENGALYIVPGTHKGPTYDHHGGDGRFCGAMDFKTAGLRFADAVPCVGPAGSCSFHHVRVVHGSAQNRSNRPRGLLLYEAAAADAFPLLGISDYDDFKSRLLCGEETVVPRIVDCPVRMPLPPALNQGSIYENQSASAKRFFEGTEVAELAGST